MAKETKATIPFSEKAAASIYEIAEAWVGKGKANELALNLVQHLKNGQFKFSVPQEISRQPVAERISIGKKFYFSDFMFLNTIRNLVTKRAEWFVDNGKEYEPFDFNGLFKQFEKVDRDITQGISSEFGFWMGVESLLKEAICPFAEAKDNLEYDALQNLMNGLSDQERENKDKAKKIVADEIERMELALAKNIYVTKEAFLRWLRLERNKLQEWWLRDKSLPEYTGFFGDAWDGFPKAWNISDEDGLILRQAFKYYSDPHDWAEYESALERAEKLDKEIDKNEEKRKAYAEVDDLKAELVRKFVSLFRSPLLKAQGYRDKTKPEEISYAQLKDMVDSKRLNIEDCSGWLGSVEIQSIRIFKNVVATTGEVELNPKVRDSLLKMVIAMAMKHYHYDPSGRKNSATALIQGSLTKYGMTLNEQTILSRLREAQELLPKDVLEEFKK